MISHVVHGPPALARNLASGETVFVLDELELQGACDWALIRSGVDVCAPGDPIAIARGLGIEIVYGHVPGCGGVLVANDPPLIIVRRRRDEYATMTAAAHEIAHYALIRTGALESHTEQDADDVAARLITPRGWVRVECLTRGRTIDELATMHPFARAAIVLARARYVLGSYVAIDDAA